MMAIIKWEIKYLMDKKNNFSPPQQAETEEHRFKWNMTIRKWFSKVDKKKYINARKHITMMIYKTNTHYHINEHLTRPFNTTATTTYATLWRPTILTPHAESCCRLHQKFLKTTLAPGYWGGGCLHSSTKCWTNIKGTNKLHRIHYLYVATNSVTGDVSVANLYAG